MRTVFTTFICLLFAFAAFSQTVMIDGVPRDTSFNLDGTYRKERPYRPYIEAVRAGLPENVRAYEEVVYKRPENGRGLTMNIYRPDDDKKYPVLMMIHGGGWNSGTKELQVPMAQQIAARGYVTIAVEYRLIPEALFPAGVDDLEDAIVWIGKNAREYGIDKKRIAVSGCSAGGQLAMLLGMKNRSGRIGAVINMDGCSTFVSDESMDRAQLARQKGETLPIDAIWLGGTYAERTKTWEDASPVFWVNKKSAPVCFINSSIPRFHTGRDEAIALLDGFGTYTEIHTFDDSPHTYWLFRPWFDPTIGHMTHFLDNVLKGK